MIQMNLKQHYPWIPHNEYIEVTEEVFEAIRAGERQEAAYRRRMYYHKAQYSLDVGDGIEHDTLNAAPTPEELYLQKLTTEQLCAALNSLPEMQGRRIEAHYLLHMKKAEIARTEGVTDGCVSESIKRGLLNMRKFFETL